MKLFKNIQFYGWALLPQTRFSSFHGVEKLFFVWMLCSYLKPFKFAAGPCSPTSPVTAQLISRRWIIISFWCYADCQQRSNERLVVLTKTRSSSFHGVKQFSRLNGRKLFKNIRIYGWAVLLQTRASSFHNVKEPFCLDVMHTFKTIQVYGWAALPNIPCHGPAEFAALKSVFVMMLCSVSTTVKSTAGRAPPNTVQFFSQCYSIFSSGWYKAFQKRSS